MRAPVVTMKRARACRREMTLPEVLLWRDLRGHQLAGCRFRRQHPMGPYILDLFCAAHRLAVEVDGTSHDAAGRAGHDLRRDRWLAEQGVRVLRLPAVDILSDARRIDALATVAAALAPSTALRAVPLPRGAGEDRTGDPRGIPFPPPPRAATVPQNPGRNEP